MKSLNRTAALALVMGSVGFAAHAQDSSETETMAGAGNAPSYCDTQWSKVDGNEDGIVSEKEASSAIEAHFAALDADGNGDITKTEYVDCRTQMDLQSAESDRDQETFDTADADSSGSLSRDEYRDASRDAYHQARLDDPDYALIRRYVFLTPTEAGDDEMVSGMSEGEAAARSVQNFSALDADGNDQISESEWEKQNPTASTSEDEANQRFAELDEDGNDTLSSEEFQAGSRNDIDATSTGSTNSDSASSSDDQAAAETTQSGSDAAESDVPVFLYWFR